MAISPDRRTIAYGGFSPSLRIARALPWESAEARDDAFYEARDELRIFTARTLYRTQPGAAQEADAIEALGDILDRRGTSRKPSSTTPRHSGAGRGSSRTIPPRACR